MIESKVKLPTDILEKMAVFVLNNNLSEFEEKVLQKISETVIGTRFASPYAYILIDKFETYFLKIQKYLLQVDL